MLDQQAENRSWAELRERLNRGYFAQGERRITCESKPGDVIPTYILWDNYTNRTYHVGASDISTLVEMKHIAIEEWEWHPNE